ncbi:hypothetical protein OnM2_065034 [Erysiphe neolycopersici]|uniref:Uncharacterized protein n=1 Tax=Erysiphe neolycopersici TaxID=212602 RepID=A0A420HMX1_9PEZI|nr:hypothetical protein OnM2_065034 [Erysiphe neolycopersici]
MLTIQVTLLPGSLPYTIRRINCNNSSSKNTVDVVQDSNVHPGRLLKKPSGKLRSDEQCEQNILQFEISAMNNPS